MSSSPEHLVYMANQIGKFFHVQGHDKTVTGVADQALSNIMQRVFDPIQAAAGITVQREKLGEDDKPIVESMKYGLHPLRHACASLWIEQRINPKRVQVLMGHNLRPCMAI